MTETMLYDALAARDWTAIALPAELVATEGDITWIVGPLDDGRWFATDDAELDPDRVTFFASRLAAIAFQWEGWLDVYPNYDDNQRTERFGWLADPDWMTAAEVAEQYHLTPGAVRVAIFRGQAHHAGVWKRSAQLWLIRACEAERLWGRR
jgi:hypothetical protein